MSPQLENETAVDSHAAPISTGVAVTGASTSYWEAPVEKTLEGKTLSTMDMSMLDAQHLEGAEAASLSTENAGSSTTGATASPASYWDAPVEKTLEGKTLSTMDMNLLDVQHPGNKEHKDAVSNEKGDSSNADPSSYWDAPPENTLEGKTLSTMDMTMLDKQHPQETQETLPRKNSFGSYWEWQGEMFKKTLSNLSLSNLAKGSRGTDNQGGDEAATQEQSKKEGSNSMGPRRGSGTGYWFWRNASMNNLSASTASLSTLEKTAKDCDASQAAGTAEREPERRASGSGGGYWLWRSGSMNKISFSNASLNTLDKAANGSDGSNNSSERSTGVGPITHLQHRLRNSWRQSFKSFSSNSLSKWEEGNPADKKQEWKEGLSGRQVDLVSEDNDDGDLDNSSSTIGGEDAITF